MVLMHRKITEELLGRSLLPGEVMHHRDGDSLNNSPDNLLVLPNQRYHAHIEHHLRCQMRGQSMLFPELMQPVLDERRGTLFEAILPTSPPKVSRFRPDWKR